MDKKITIDEWLDICAETISDVSDRFSDDGKISVADGLTILFNLLKNIAKAYKND